MQAQKQSKGHIGKSQKLGGLIETADGQIG